MSTAQTLQLRRCIIAQECMLTAIICLALIPRGKTNMQRDEPPRRDEMHSPARHTLHSPIDIAIIYRD